MNTAEENDRRLRELVALTVFPRRACESHPNEIEAMLDSVSGVPLSDFQVQRILKKVAGELPIGEQQADEPIWSEVGLSPEEQELVALHRSKGVSLPPDISEKLKRYRDEARKKRLDDKNCGG